MNKLIIAFLIVGLFLAGACSENDNEKKPSIPIVDNPNDNDGGDGDDGEEDDDDDSSLENYFVMGDTVSLENAKIYFVSDGIFNSEEYHIYAITDGESPNNEARYISSYPNATYLFYFELATNYGDLSVGTFPQYSNWDLVVHHWRI
jgi:hypothetical protein